VTVALIAAVAENGVIGRGGGLPWHLPDDLRWFKQLTMGHPVVIGRRTFDTLGRPLPGRRWIVLSRNPAFHPDGVETAPDLRSALAAAGHGDVFVAGGADVYRAALPLADRLYLTVVHARVEGDTRFPEVDFDDWTLMEERHHPADARHRHAFTFRTYARRASRVHQNT
jgi:dihydrofolate reductase